MPDKKKQKTPYWVKKLFLKVIDDIYKQIKHSKTKPSIGKDNIDFYALIWYLYNYKKYNWEKIQKYIYKVSMIKVEKNPKLKPIKLERSTIYLRLKEAKENLDKVEKRLNEWREKYKDQQLQQIKELINYDVLTRFEQELKKPKELRNEKLLMQLAEKLTSYPSRAFRDTVTEYAKSIIVGEKTQGRITILKKLILFYQFMKDKMGLPNPKEWRKEDIIQAFKKLQYYVLDTKSMSIIPVKEYYNGRVDKIKLDSISSQYSVIVHMFKPEAKRVWNIRGMFKESGAKRGEQYVLEPNEYLEAKRKVLAMERIKVVTPKGEKEIKLTPELKEELDILLDLHITTQAREGSVKTKRGGIEFTGGILDVRYNDFYETSEGLKVMIREPKTMKKLGDRPAIWDGIVVDLIFDDKHPFGSLSKRIRRLAQKRNRDFSSNEHIFTAVKYPIYTAVVKALGKIVGKNITPHDLRRTGAYWKVKYWNVPLETISGFTSGSKKFTSPLGVGWESPQTLLEYYVDLSFKSARVVKAVKQAGLNDLMFKDPDKAIEKAREIAL